MADKPDGTRSSEPPQRGFGVEIFSQGQGGGLNAKEDTIDGGELIGMGG